MWEKLNEDEGFAMRQSFHVVSQLIVFVTDYIKLTQHECKQECIYPKLFTQPEIWAATEYKNKKKNNSVIKFVYFNCITYTLHNLLYKVEL